MAREFQRLREDSLSQEKDLEGGLRLNRFSAALKRHLFLIVGATTLATAAAIVKTVAETPVYQAEFELSTPPVTLETQIVSAISDENNSKDRIDAGLLDETKLKILTSPRIMDPVVTELQERYPDITYRSVVDSLKISPSSTGKILTVDYQSDDAEEVTAVLELVAQAYLKYSLTDRQNNVDRGIDFVDQQLPVVRGRVNELEAELEQLRRNSSLIDPLLQGTQLSERAADLKSQQMELRVQIDQTYKIYQELAQELTQGKELSATSVLLASDRYQALLNQMLAIDSQLADERTLYLEDSPEIEVIKEQKANLKPLLEREGLRVKEQVASLIRELEAREQALSNSVASMNSQMNKLSTVAREYNSIQRDLDIASANLNQFLTKREVLRIDAAQQRTPWEMLTTPSAPKASSANAQLNLMLGSLLGLLAGSGLALLLDRMGNKIHTVEDLKETTLVPLLGTVPYNRRLRKGRLPMVATNAANAALFGLSAKQYGAELLAADSFFESFKRLATNIRLSNPDTPIKTLTVSSAIAGVGKSTVSYHLARAYAAMGQRTLLVDTDLRRPGLHKLAGIANARGLSNYVSGELEMDDIIVSLPTDELMSVAAAGSIPPDPAKVLSSRRMDAFLQQAYEDFDMVIFDTPPLLGFADAFMVVKKTQGLLLTTRLGYVKFSQVQSVLDELQVAKVPVIGLVANGSRQTNEVYAAYQKYYRSLPVLAN